MHLEIITPPLLKDRVNEVKRFAPDLSKSNTLNKAADSVCNADMMNSHGFKTAFSTPGCVPLPNTLYVSRQSVYVTENCIVFLQETSSVAHTCISKPLKYSSQMGTLSS